VLRSELAEDLDGPLPHPRGLAAIVAHEQALVSQGHADGCGKTCDDGCHGDLACIRVVHPHRPDGEQDDSGAPLPADVVPHVGYGPNGELVQWTCLPGDHDGLTVETRQIARMAAATQQRVEATRRFLDGLDMTVLAGALAGPLAAALAARTPSPEETP
jgi:hypothetical protein